MDTTTAICADEDQNLDRFRSQMVLCAVEQALGSVFIKHCSQLLVDDPVVRQVGALITADEKTPLTKEMAQVVVTDTYMKQVFDLAIASTKGTPTCDCLKELYALAEILELFDIRNAAAHPNRPFYRYFWLRIAAFAADPRFTRLNLLEVVEKLHRALSGQIERPPEQWFVNVSQIPNNLPARFEHGVTGLVGRDEEKRRLWAEIRNPRKHFISIVSPGGNGKTALALEFLNEFTTSTNGTALADAVIFVSMKMLSLTAAGPIELRCSRTIAELEQEIATEISSLLSDECNEFNSIKQKFGDQQILLCIDNLETILIDSPDALGPFEANLPQSWKLIVTSRIPVENASTLPLAPLKPPAANKLVRSYITGCGYPRPDDQLVEAIIAGTRSNPLAIKLVIDTYIGGKDITASISKAAEDTTEFSFSNLLDVLSDAAVDVMESLFVDEEISRMNLVEALGQTTEQIGHAIQDLCRTSLAYREISASTSREIVRLNEQVRELLLLKPKRITTREKVEKYLRAQRAQLQGICKQIEDKDELFDLCFIPTNFPPDLQILLKAINKAANLSSGRSQAHLQDAYRKTMLAESEYSSCAIYWRSRARLMWACKDHTAAYQCLEKALGISPNDFITSRLQAEWLISESKADESLGVVEKLISDGGADPEKVGVSFASHVHSLHLHCLIFLGQNEEVSQKTNNWHKNSQFGYVESVARIRCFKRWSEDRNNPESEARLLHALNTFASAATMFGIFGPMETVGCELLNEIVFIGKNHLETRSIDFVRGSAAFLGRFLRDLVDSNDSLWLEVNRLFPRYQKLISESQPKRNIATSPEALDQKDAYIERGYTLARVTVIPAYFENSPPSYMFATDDNGDDYFLHKSSYQKRNRIAWGELKPGSIVALKREVSNRGSSKWRATEIESIEI